MGISYFICTQTLATGVVNGVGCLGSVRTLFHTRFGRLEAAQALALLGLLSSEVTPTSYSVFSAFL